MRVNGFITHLTSAHMEISTQDDIFIVNTDAWSGDEEPQLGMAAFVFLGKGGMVLYAIPNNEF